MMQHYYIPPAELELADAIEDAKTDLRNKRLLLSVGMVGIIVPIFSTFYSLYAAIHAQSGSGGLIAAVFGTIISIIVVVLTVFAILFAAEEVWEAQKELTRAERKERDYRNRIRTPSQ